MVSKKQAALIIFAFLCCGLFLGAVTQIDLAHQVSGLLPGTNGGTGISSTATFPATGTVMITTTGVTASQLPNPSASTLGGIESITCGANSAVTTISTSGVPSCVSTQSAITWNQAAPSGSINGSNTSFTLSPTPAASADVNCFLNGVQQQQGSGNDYTISGATITYLTAPPTGSKLNCLWY